MKFSVRWRTRKKPHKNADPKKFFAQVLRYRLHPMQRVALRTQMQAVRCAALRTPTICPHLLWCYLWCYKCPLIDHALGIERRSQYLDYFMIVFFHNIVIFSKITTKDIEHLRLFLRLKEREIYAKNFKRHIYVHDLDCLVSGWLWGRIKGRTWIGGPH